MSEDKSWKPLIEKFFKTSEGKKLEEFLAERKKEGAEIFPKNPFYGLSLTPKDKVKVVILGQDPYHGEGQAHGLAFSVPEGVKIPPSLRNIFKELKRSLDVPEKESGNLEEWAKQGVLLLNTILTVEKGSPLSHAKKGWEKLTDEVIREIAASPEPTVFLLWGKPAQEKEKIISEAGGNNLILKSNHPSPLSATKKPVPFIGNNHFKEANEWLEKQGEKPIRW